MFSLSVRFIYVVAGIRSSLLFMVVWYPTVKETDYYLPHASVGTVVCLPFCLLYKAAMSVLVLS